MILKALLGTSAQGLLLYISKESKTGHNHTYPFFTNMAGQTPKELAKEIGSLRRQRPNLKKAVAHLVLSHDPTDRKLTEIEWKHAISVALKIHGADQAAFCSYRHHDTAHDHTHVFYCRVLPGGQVVSDSHNFRKNETAARQIEKELKLNSPTPTQNPPGDREATQNATRRAERRGTLSPAKVSAQAVREALAQAKNRTHFVQILQEQGVEAAFDRRGSEQQIYGWRLRAAGAQEWLKGSTLAKDLSWPKIGHRLGEEDQDSQESPAPVVQRARTTQIPEMLKPYLSKPQYSAKQLHPLERPMSAQTEEFQPAKLDLAPVTGLDIGPLSKVMLLIGGALVNFTSELVRRIIEFIKALLSKFGIGLRESALQTIEHPSKQFICYEPYIEEKKALPAPTATEAACEQLIQIHDALQNNDSSLLPAGEGREEVVAAMEAERTLSGVASVADDDFDFGFSASDLSQTKTPTPASADPLAALLAALKVHQLAAQALQNAQIKKGFIYFDSRPKAWAERNHAVEKLEQVKDKFKQWKAANPIFSNLPISKAKNNFATEIKQLEGFAAAANAAAKAAEAADTEAEKRYKALPPAVPSPEVVMTEQTTRTAMKQTRVALQNSLLSKVQTLRSNPMLGKKLAELEGALSKNFVRFEASGEIKKPEFDMLSKIQSELKTLEAQGRALDSAAASIDADRGEHEQQRG